MTSVWALAALWLSLALIAGLLSIWLRISTALSEIVVGTVAQLIFGAVIGSTVLGTDESWIKFLSGIGAIVLTFLAGAELDPAVFKQADVLVAHYTGGRPAVIDSSRGVTHADETEEMRKAVRAALKEHELPNLHDLVLGRAKGRTAPEEVSCFLNYVGLGYQFAAVGSLLYRKARELGIGRELPTDWFTEDVNP